MYPYLTDGDKILVKKIFTPKKNDIVVFFNPTVSNTEIYYVKRIETIKNNKYFVLGDNRKESVDSRQFGWIDHNVLIGKMIMKLPTGKEI